MPDISFDLDPKAELIGKLIGLLSDTGGFNANWFSDPGASLKGIPNRLSDLLGVIDATLAPASEDGPPLPEDKDAQWYPIRNPLDGRPTGFYLVTPKSTTDLTSAVIGGGVLTTFANQNLTLTAYGYLPLFELSTTAAPSFVLTSKAAQIGLRVKSSDSTNLFSGGDGNDKFTFSAIDLDAQVILAAPQPKTLELMFENVKIGTESPNNVCYESLQAVTKDISKIVEWIAAVILQGSYWLNTYVGDSVYTVGDLLNKANILKVVKSGDGDDATEKYELDATYLSNNLTTPKKIAEDFFFALLSELADSEDPLIPVPNGGIYIAKEEDEKTTGLTHYGARLVIEDLAIGESTDKPQPEEASAESGTPEPGKGEAKAKAEVMLQIGKWLGGEDDENSWVARSLGSTTEPPKPGVSVFLLSHDDSGKITFDPYYEFISLGLDIKGGDQQPLVNSGGYVLSGGELRTYVTEKQGDFSFGAAASLDGLGVRLGPGFGASGKGSNPVAQSLLESGSKPDAPADKSGKDAVNPSFGFSLGWVRNGQVVAQLYDKEGTPANVVTIPLQHALGPLYCEKLGVGWIQDSKELSLIFDGGVKLGTLDVDLVDLSIGIPVTTPGDFSKYELDLNGLGIDFKAGQVEVSAALVKLPKTDQRNYVEYDGEALVKASALALSAIGSYAYVSAGSGDQGYASLFIFGVLDYEVGDPTGTGALFITGLAAGFGYNRGLKLPAQDAVAEFPLVAGTSDPSKLGGDEGKTPGPAEALAKLGDLVPPERGEYWLAAGIRFTSYDLINSTALIVVEFGNELEISLLGLSWISLPPPSAPGAKAPEKKFAYGELGIEVKILPSEGAVTATAILTPNSFVIDPACKLTGGFAFYTWFGSNPHAGEFVLTLGGYHPDFHPPSYFPNVPRLGFSWPMTGDVTVSGDAYFALTPSAVMAGGGLQVLFHQDSLRAWFKADMNVLIQWAPFHYTADIGVSIGVSVRVEILFVTTTISVELGADLTLTGPPMSGVAHVHFYIVSFTVRFGSEDAGEPQPLDWQNDDGTGFAQTLLPHKTSGSIAKFLARAADTLARLTDKVPVPGDVSPSGLYTIAVNDGLLKNYTNNQGETIWIVRGNHFVFSVVTAMPCTKVTVTSPNGGTSYTPKDCPNPDNDYFICIRPMKATLKSSELTITLTGENNQTYDLPREFDIDVASGAVPDAKWGKPLPKDTDPDYNKQLPSRLLGLKNMRPKAPSLTPSAPPLDINVRPAFTYDVVDDEVPVHPYHLPLQTGASAIGAVPRDDNGLERIKSSLMSAAAVKARGSILELLQEYGVDPVTNGDLTEFVADPGKYLNGVPLVAGAV